MTAKESLIPGFTCAQPGLPTLAERFASLALANIRCEYPHKLDQVLASSADLAAPRALHPSFHGSYDWHSCVHMHWLLARVRRAFPALAARSAIEAQFDTSFAPAAVAGEAAYLARAHTQSFERTYGWAWLLKLGEELLLADDAKARAWSAELAPLAQAFVARYLGYLPKLRYPIRYGTHANSAFGLAFALDYARKAGEDSLERRCVASAQAWFGADRDAPAAWEPSGADFLSPALTEALLMSSVLPAREFAAWLHAFLPGVAERQPTSLFVPAEVGDRADPQLVHLDGLNLSRAWCMRAIAQALPQGDARAPVLREAADAHFAAGMSGIASGEFVGEHWLASFALLAAHAGDAKA
jgi:hypothetical protein